MRIHHGSPPRVVARAVLRAIRAREAGHSLHGGHRLSGLLKVARTILPTSLFDKAVHKTFAMDHA